MKYLLIVAMGMFVVASIAIGYHWLDRGEVHVLTDPSAFVSAKSLEKIVEETDGEIYLLVGITPAPFPEEADVIYRAAKNRRKTVIVTLKNTSPAVTFKMIGGLTKEGDMRIQCASREEAKALSSHLKVRWRE